MMHMKVFGLAALVVGGLSLATAASALPFNVAPVEAVASDVSIETVAFGCGTGFHPGAYGGCRPNYGPGRFYGGYGGGYGYYRPRPVYRPYGYYRPRPRFYVGF